MPCSRRSLANHRANCIGGIDAPDQGQIHFDGRDNITALQAWTSGDGRKFVGGARSERAVASSDPVAYRHG